MITDAERLAKIRERLAGASQDFALDYSGGEAISAVIHPTAPPVIIAQLTVDCPYTDRDLLVHARADLAFLNDLVIRHGKARERDRQQIGKLQGDLARQAGKPAKDYAAECAMKCQDRAFIRWLIELHALPEDATATAIETRVRSLLGIASRKDLNADLTAANRWRAMVKDFEDWRRR